ncbi:alpha/beta hydrolase domain-containing protein [Pseudoroseicyclus sp. CXY001]|uniref:alpha/beta hydrolase domain-containing protein n=1 Tax=Pseudoroseicyclus sp. CXY001 TaxID=3242492 RepID=UPI0035717119
MTMTKALGRIALPATAAAALMAASGAFAQEVPAMPEVSGPIATTLGDMAHPSRRGPTLGQNPPMDWPADREPAFFDYVEDEFFITGEANGAPYTTRFVFRHPADPEAFSGYVSIETLHPAQSAQMWMASRVGGMMNGHGYVEVVNTPGLIGSLQAYNPGRYADLAIEGAVTEQGQPDPAQNEIIAQIANLVQVANPLGDDWNAEYLVMSGASATSRTAMNFMEAENGANAWQAEDGSPIIDAMYVWDTDGPTQEVLDSTYSVPVIILSTETEFMDGPRVFAEDSDEEGSQFRLYQVAGMPHLESREMYEAGWSDCTDPIDDFWYNAMVFQGLDWMYDWLAEGEAPPMADKIQYESEEVDAAIVRDEYGNAMGGVRSPQVEVPRETFTTPNAGGFVCTLMGISVPLDAETLGGLYTSPGDYRAQLTEATVELIEDGWFPEEYLFEIEEEVERYAEQVGAM